MPDVQPIIRTFKGNLIAGTTNAIARATRDGLARELPTIIQGLGAALDRRMLPDRDMEAINYRIARQAQAAVVASLDSRLPRKSLPYNPGQRLTGKLRPALASEAMLAGTSPRVISFINENVLGQTARHWYRVNYGAYGSNLFAPGSQEAASYALSINGRPIAILRDDSPPSTDNYLPANFFWVKGPVNMLIASRGPATNGRANGARAARFIDPGLRVVAEQFGPSYDRFFRTWVMDAKNRARLLQRTGVQVVADVRLESYGWSVT
jgi:hypothetical protein